MYDKNLIIGHNIIKEVLLIFLELEEKGIQKLKGKGGLMEYLESIKYDLNTFSFAEAIKTLKERGAPLPSGSNLEV